MPIDEVLTLLCARFPKTFFLYEVRRRPLKLGIHHDVVAVIGKSIGRKHLRLALSYYAGNHGYLRAQQVGAERIDLDGAVAGTVTEDEAENAKRMLAGISVKRDKPNQKKPEPRRDGLAALREAAAARRKQLAARGAP